MYYILLNMYLNNCFKHDTTTNVYDEIKEIMNKAKRATKGHKGKYINKLY